MFNDDFIANVIFPILCLIIGGLITFFLNNRNLEDKMRKVADDAIDNSKKLSDKITDIAEKTIDNHNKIKHQDSPWDISEKVLRDHSENCGKELKNDVKGIKESMQEMLIVQSTQKNILDTVSKQILCIIKKMNIVLE